MLLLPLCKGSRKSKWNILSVDFVRSQYPTCLPSALQFGMIKLQIAHVQSVCHSVLIPHVFLLSKSHWIDILIVARRVCLCASHPPSYQNNSQSGDPDLTCNRSYIWPLNHQDLVRSDILTLLIGVTLNGYHLNRSRSAKILGAGNASVNRSAIMSSD